MACNTCIHFRKGMCWSVIDLSPVDIGSEPEFVPKAEQGLACMNWEVA